MHRGAWRFGMDRRDGEDRMTTANCARTLPLLPAPDGPWQAEFDRLIRGSRYLQVKYDRPRRLREKLDYIERYCPEVCLPAAERPGLVLDVGPGPGEFIEWCRHFGRAAAGIDEEDGAGGMGTAYVKLCRMMHERQALNVSYEGFRLYLEFLREQPAPLGFLLVNFQGSWCYVWRDFLDGPPLDGYDMDTRHQQWRFSDRLDWEWERAFTIMRRHLVPGGSILIWDNAVGEPSCQERFRESLVSAAWGAGLIVQANPAPLLYKFAEPEKVS